jgi:hypothetical protein
VLALSLGLTEEVLEVLGDEKGGNGMHGMDPFEIRWWMTSRSTSRRAGQRTWESPMVGRESTPHRAAATSRRMRLPTMEARTAKLAMMMSIWTPFDWDA